MDANPSGNGDITSILRILPNVQYDHGQNKSATPGEIDPANISISGGLYYQNNFQLDGFNMNNDLDPIATSQRSTGLSSPGASIAFEAANGSISAGRSQGLNVDTSLLDSIIVQDSNISASYGGFLGGVVEATTKKATKTLSGNISYQITQGNAKDGAFSLTQYHIYAPSSDEYLSFLNSTSAANQPKFHKHIFRASLESKFSDNAGVIASFTTTQSFIPLRAWSSSYIDTTTDSKIKTQKRQSYNFFIKAHYDPSENLSLETSYAFMPQYNNYFSVSVKDSGFDMQSGGHNLGAKAIWSNALGVLNAQTSFSHLQSSMSGASNTRRTWYYSDEKSWNPRSNTSASPTQSEGSYGNVDTKQLTFSLKVAQNFKPLQTQIFEHNFNVGTEANFVNAFYQRKNDALWSGGTAGSANAGYTLTPMQNGAICTDFTWCSNSIVDISKLNTAQRNRFNNNNGQYFTRISLFEAGKINLNNLAFGAFVEDDIKIALGFVGEMNTRIGLRLDYDTYMEKVTLAPRFALNYITPAPKDYQTQLTFGANRYYGRNLFAYALSDGRSAMQWELKRTSETQSWDDPNITRTQTKNNTKFNQLNVPYSNEFMVGINQKIAFVSVSAKYIYRAGRDEIVQKCIERTTSSCQVYGYDNSGRSGADVVSVAIENHGGLDFGVVKNHILFAFDWTNTRRNYRDYSEVMSDPSLANQYISYNGKLMLYIDRPAENFTRPYTFRLNTTTSFSLGRTKWLWNNFFRFRSPYDAMVSVAKDSYCENPNNASLSWCNKPLRDKFDIDGDGVLEYVDTLRLFRVPFSFDWDMRIGFEIESGGNVLYFNVDIYNVLNRKNMAITSFSGIEVGNAGVTAVPIYEVGRQFWLQVGYKF